MTQILDLSSLERVKKGFDEILARYKREKNDDAIRDAAIQRFEYTYSLAYKMIERFIKIHSENDETLTFNETIRRANQLNLLSGDLDKWNIYRQKRNVTSHVYDENKALEVISIVDDFSFEIDYLIKQLKVKNG